MHLFCHNTTCRINAWKSQPCSFAGIRHCLNMWKHFTHSVFFLVYFILFWIWVVVFGEQGQSLSDMSQCMRPLNINIGHFRFQGFILFPFKLAKSLLLWVAWFCLNSINQSQRSEILLCIPQVASRSSLLDFCRFIQGYFPEIIFSVLFYEAVFILHKPSLQILSSCCDPVLLRSDCHICLT